MPTRRDRELQRRKRMTRMSTLEQVQKMKLHAEIKKLGAESDKLMMETRWYPIVVATGLVAALVALTKVFL